MKQTWYETVHFLILAGAMRSRKLLGNCMINSFIYEFPQS